jgi:hypothetical protein
VTNETDLRAAEIRAKAKEFGMTVRAHDQIVTVYGTFEPGNKSAYVDMENNAYRLLGMFKQVRAGSTWGADSGSVGGAIGLEKGNVTMHKSGVEKRLAAKFYNN